MIVCEKLHPLSILRLLLLVCADLFAIFYFHSYFTLVLLICLILIPAVSLYVTAYMLKHTALSVHASDKQITRGSPCNFTVEIRNSSVFPLLIVTVLFFFENTFLNTSDKTRNRSCSPGRFSRFTITAPTDACGSVTLHLLSMTVSDFFGIADFKKTISITTSSAILPVPAGLSDQERRLTENACVSCIQTAGSDEYSHIREFLPGDPLNRIHWKLSARTSVLMVKQYQQESGSSPRIYLELSANDTEKINRILDRAYSLALYCLNLEYYPVFCLPDSFPADLQNYSIEEEEILEQYFCELLQTPLPETAYFEHETFTEHDILINQDGNYETFNTFYSEIEN